MILRRTSECVRPRAGAVLVVVVVVLGTLTTALAHQEGAGTTLIVRMVRMQPAQADTGPPIGVAELESGRSPEDRVHHCLPPDRIPANAPLVLLWRGNQLSSPDTIAVRGANWNGHGIDVQIELRRFDGTLHLNTVTVPVVEVDLGTLEPGPYEVSFHVTELWFSDLDHPENAAQPSTQHTSFSFRVL